MPTYDTTSTGTISAAASNGTCSHTVAANGDELLLVCVSVNNGNNETVSSVTYNSVALTYLDSYAQGDDGLVELWHLYGPDTGSSHTVSVTMSAGLEQAAVFAAISFSDAHQTDAFGTVAKNNSVDEGSEAYAEVIISSAVGQTVIGFHSGDNNWNASTVVGGTERWDVQHGTASGAGATAAGAASVTLTWTPGTGDSWAAMGVGIKPPDAAEEGTVLSGDVAIRQTATADTAVRQTALDNAAIRQTATADTAIRQTALDNAAIRQTATGEVEL